MLSKCAGHVKKGISQFFGAEISEKYIACLCILLIAAMLLPLLAIAPYNYPADDDFGFVLPVATAWVNTGSLWEVVKAIYQKTYEIYMTWQGNFVSTALFCFTPMVFDIDLYFIGNWAMLAMLCLSVGYLFKSVCRCLGAGKSAFWIGYTATLILTLQFMPSIAYSIFWHNGGQYTTAACTLFLLMGILLNSTQEQSKKRLVWRTVAACILGFLIGGSFYGPMLGAAVLVVLLCICSCVSRSKCRWQCLAALAGMIVSVLISVLAPGNALRQERTGEAVSAVATVLNACLDSFDLFGQWITPQLIAMLALIVAALWRALRNSQYQFRHPFGVFVMLYGLFSASLAPGIYTTFGYTTERYLNVIYFYFLIMAIGSTLYACGWLIRMLESKQTASAEALLKATMDLGKKYSVRFLALLMVLVVLGGFANTIMNVPSVNALKCLVTGEAAQFHADMMERQEYIRVTDSDVVDVQPLASQPYVFKRDRLPFQGIYGRVRYMKWYFELFHNAENGIAP